MNINANELSPAPQGFYVTACRHGDLIFSSGMTPRHNGKLLYTGPARKSEPIASYRAPVVLACANAVAAILHAMHDGEQLAKILNLSVYIAAEPDFEAHSQLADFASEYLHDKFGDVGIGSRAALGVASLPSQALIEIQITVATGQ